MERLLALDRQLFHGIYDLGGESLRWLFVGITHLGSHGGVWILMAFGLSIFGRERVRRVGLAMAAMLAFNVLVNELILKHGVGRTRPWKALGVTLHDTAVNPHGYSFASGHAVCAFAGCLILGAALPRWRWPLLVLAALIALSRVVLGAHYPSDIIVGSLLGVLAGPPIARWVRVAPERHEAVTTEPDLK